MTRHPCRAAQVFALVLVFVITPAGCGGGDTYESLAAASMENTKQLVATLDTIKDEATAKAAKPKLKTLLEKMNDLNQRQAKLPAPTEADAKAIDAKYGKEMEELQMKMAGHMMRISFDPKIRAELADLDEVMRKAQK